MNVPKAKLSAEVKPLVEKPVTAAKPPAKTAAKPAVRPATKPAAKAAAKPSAKAAAKPSAKAATKPAAKAATKPAAKALSNTATKPATKPAVKTAAKVAPKASTRATAKPVRPAKPAANANGVAESVAKVRKPKVVQASFALHADELTFLKDLKQACKLAATNVKKSELMRAALTLLKTIDVAAVKVLVEGLPAVKSAEKKKL